MERRSGQSDSLPPRMRSFPPLLACVKLLWIAHGFWRSDIRVLQVIYFCGRYSARDMLPGIRGGAFGLSQTQARGRLAGTGAIGASIGEIRRWTVRLVNMSLEVSLLSPGATRILKPVQVALWL
jgi:hypothetical protein